MEIVLIIAVVVGLMIAGGIYSAKKERQRVEGLIAFAQAHTLELNTARDPAIPARFQRFGVFSRGHSRLAYNTMTGSTSVEGRTYPICTGDYTFKEEQGSGKNRRTVVHRCSYLVVQVPFPCVEQLTLRRENVFDKIGGALGFDDIDFESAEFSRRFFVKSNNRKFAYDLIDPRMMEWLLEVRDNAPPIQLYADLILFCDGLGRWTPEQFADRFEFARQFLSRWPGHVLRTLEERQGAST